MAFRLVIRAGATVVLPVLKFMVLTPLPCLAAELSRRFRVCASWRKFCTLVFCTFIWVFETLTNPVRAWFRGVNVGAMFRGLLNPWRTPAPQARLLRFCQLWKANKELPHTGPANQGLKPARAKWGPKKLPKKKFEKPGPHQRLLKPHPRTNRGRQNHPGLNHNGSVKYMGVNNRPRSRSG